MMVKRLFLYFAVAVTTLILSPFLLWALLPVPMYSRFTAPSQLLSLVPGYTGVLLRRVWYKCTLSKCGERLTVDWLAVIRTSDAEIGNRVTIGVGNWIGWAKIGDDVMTGSHVVIVSGRKQHDFEDLTRPMREQHGRKERVVIGNDVWIGSHATIMADISDGTVVGAGSVVTKSFGAESVIAGNPAKTLRQRR